MEVKSKKAVAEGTAHPLCFCVSRNRHNIFVMLRRNNVNQIVLLLLAGIAMAGRPGAQGQQRKFPLAKQ
jgi:hypothetical protein